MRDSYRARSSSGYATRCMCYIVSINNFGTLEIARDERVRLLQLVAAMTCLTPAKSKP